DLQDLLGQGVLPLRDDPHRAVLGGTAEGDRQARVGSREVGQVGSLVVEGCDAGCAAESAACPTMLNESLPGRPDGRRRTTASALQLRRLPDVRLVPGVRAAVVAADRIGAGLRRLVWLAAECLGQQLSSEYDTSEI